MATIEQKHNLSDSHWYTRMGVPAYTIKKAKGGGERSTTLRDARKHNLLPSVTTIFNIMSKPGLDSWKLNKAIEAALSTQRDDGEPDDHYYKRIIERSRSEVSEAADLGTRIHDAIEASFPVYVKQIPEDLEQYVNPTMDLLHDLSIENPILEKVVVNHKEGYAGRADLMGKVTGSNKSWNVVVDFKTRKTKKGVKITPYDFQPMQLAAYAMAAFGTLDNCLASNLYISTTEPGRVENVAYSEKKLKEEYDAFLHMNAMWRYLKKYDPRS